MKLKTKKILIAGAAGSIVVGAGLAIALPLALQHKTSDKAFIENKLDLIMNAKNEKEAQKLARDITDLTYDNGDAGAAADALGSYLFNQTKDKKATFKTKIKEENGIAKVVINVTTKATTEAAPAIKGQATTTGAIPKLAFNIDPKDKTWAEGVVANHKATFGIYLELVNDKIYTIQGIGSEVDSTLQNLDQGYVNLLHFLKNLKAEDYDPSKLGNDGTKKPSELTLEDLFSTTAFKQNAISQDLSTLSTFFMDATPKALTIKNAAATSESQKTDATAAPITITFLNKEFTFTLGGFAPNNQKSPVDTAYNALNGTKQAKTDTLKNTGPYDIAWVNNVLGTNLTDNDVTYTFSDSTWTDFTFTTKIKIVDKKDPTKIKIAELTIEGFISQQDLDAATLFGTDTKINAALTAVVGAPLDTKLASDEMKNIFTTDSNKKGTVDVEDNTNKFKVNLVLVNVDDTTGSITYNYEVSTQDVLGYANKLLSKPINGTYTLSGFKQNASDSQKKDAANAYLAEFKNNVTVPGQSAILASTLSVGDDAPQAIKDAYNNFSTTQAKPFGTPIFKIVSTDDTDGSVVVKVTYTYGTETATKDITFDGYQTAANADEAAIQQDLDAVKAKAPTTITLTGSPKIPTGAINTLTTVNDLLESANKLPAPINGVARTYTATKDENTGTIKIEVGFSLHNTTKTYTFTISGYQTKTGAIQAEIDAEKAKYDGKSEAGYHNPVNTFKKDDTPSVADINKILDPAHQLHPAAGLTWEITVTSAEFAEKLEFDIKISSAQGGTAQTAKYSVTDVVSQATHDLVHLDTAVLAELKTVMGADGTTDASTNASKIPTAAIKITSDSTEYEVTITKDPTAPFDDNAGTFKFKYTASAAGLPSAHTSGDLILSGFKVNKSDAEKKTAVQAELDAISSPVDSGKPGVAPDEYTDALAKALLDPKVINNFGVAAVYALGAKDDGTIKVTITYTFGTEKAEKEITIGGLKDNATIATGKINDIKNAVKIKDATAKVSITDKDGVAELAAFTAFTATDATKWNIDLPADLKGVTVKWKHGALAKDGDLDLTFEFSLTGGTAATKTIKVTVEGIDKAIIDDAIKTATLADVIAKLPKLKADAGDITKLASSLAKPADGTLDNGVDFKFTKWDVDVNTGNITWNVEFSGHGTTETATPGTPGTIAGFAKQVSDLAAGDITGVKGDDTGLVLSGATIAGRTDIDTSKITYSTISAGAKTVDVTIVLKDGFLFSDGKNTKIITGVVVDQAAYEAKQAAGDLAAAKTAKKTEINAITVTEDKLAHGDAEFTAFNNAKTAALAWIDAQTDKNELDTKFADEKKKVEDAKTAYEASTGLQAQIDAASADPSVADKTKTAVEYVNGDVTAPATADGIKYEIKSVKAKAGDGSTLIVTITASAEDTSLTGATSKDYDKEITGLATLDARAKDEVVKGVTQTTIQVPIMAIGWDKANKTVEDIVNVGDNTYKNLVTTILKVLVGAALPTDLKTATSDLITNALVEITAGAADNSIDVTIDLTSVGGTKLAAINVGGFKPKATPAMDLQAEVDKFTTPMTSTKDAVTPASPLPTETSDLTNIYK